MKKIAKFLALVGTIALSVVLNTSPTVAQTQPAPSHPVSLPVGSLEQLWIWSAHNIRGGYAQIYGSTILDNTQQRVWEHFDYVPSGLGDNLEKLAETMNRIPFAFSVSRTDLALNSWVNLQDKKGRDLFYGGRDVHIIPAGDKFTFVSKQVRPRIADVVYIPYSGAVWATFVERDQYGNLINYHSIPVVDGEIAFPVGLISNSRELWKGEVDPGPKKYGEVKVTVRDGNGYHEDSYSVDNNGAYMVPKFVSGTGLDVGLNGFIPWSTDNARVQFSVTEANAQFVGVLKYTYTTRVTIFPTEGVDGFSKDVPPLTEATRGKLIRASDLAIIAEFTTSKVTPFFKDLPAGTYYLILNEWSDPTFGEDYREYHYIPNQKGATPVVVAEP